MDRANHPAVYVSWDNAVDYCRWLTGQAKRHQCYVQAKKAEPAGAGGDATPPPPWSFDPNQNGFRLPTEAEREYACRAGTTATFNFGSDETWLGKYARFGQAYADPIPTVVCATLRPNRRGLFDMQGNVYGWCWDRYDDYDPKAGKVAVDPVGPVPRSDKPGRIPACEILVNSAAVSENIRDANKALAIPDLIREGTVQYGMQSFDQSLLNWYKQGVISYEAALAASSSPSEFALRVQGIAGSSEGDWSQVNQGAR